MGNCLVTKLAGEINADLPKLGNITLLVDADSSSVDNTRFLGVTCTQSITIDVTDGGSITGKGSKFILEPGTHSLTCSTGTYFVKMYPCYSITKLQTGYYVKVNDVAELVSLSNPADVTFWIQSSDTSTFGVGGNIDKLAIRGYGSIKMKDTAARLFLSGCSGNVASLGVFDLTNNVSNIGGVVLRNSYIKGDIAAFASFDTWKTARIIISTNRSNVGKIYGNVEAFKDYTGITNFDMNYIELTGSLVVGLGKMVDFW